MPEKLVANGRFKLVGTDAQNAILEPIFVPGAPDYIRFPWPLMDALPTYPVPISWDDLNDGTLASIAERTHEYTDLSQPARLHPRFHGDSGEGHGTSRPGYMLGKPEKRYMIAGVFWSDGRIKIDIRMEARPAAAREVCSAELAHAVDYGMPLTDAMKNQIVTLFHPGGQDTHTWWEVQSYGAEYYTLVGEGFMALFTHAYSEMEPWQDPFTHKSTKAMAPAVHQILGAVPVGGGPVPTDVTVKYLKPYRTFHKSGPGSHYEQVWKKQPPGRVVRLPRAQAVSEGRVPCKSCKP